MTSPNRELREKIAAEAGHAEATRDASLRYRRRRPGRSSVYGLRLPDERIEQLRRLAQARGTEPSALVRQWVIDHLDAAEQARDPGTEQWERDFRTTTDHLRQLLDELPWAQAS
jgi:predicted transcriptional regulator